MLLELQNLEVVYHESIRAVQGISISVPVNDKVAVLGANGAGKSTILRAIAGLLLFYGGRISKGSISFGDEDITELDTRSIVRKGFCLAPEGRKLFEHLTVEENLIVGGSLNQSPKTSKDNIQRVYEYFPVLSNRRKQVSGYLSGGEQQMLVIGRALMTETRLLAIDELSLGLAPLVIEQLTKRLSDIWEQQKMSILLIEQNAEMALSFVSYGYIIENGRIALNGPSHELRDNDDVKEFYLGMSVSDQKKSFADIKYYKKKKRWLV